MQYLSADCIISITGEPHYNSVLAVADNGTIDGIFSQSELQDPLIEIRHYKGILCPGFVNTHCHLELSWAKDLISPGEGLDRFIWQLEKFRKSVSETFIHKAIENAAYHMKQSGVVATADIINRDYTYKFKSSTKDYFHTFVEVFGSDADTANEVFERAEQLEAQFGSGTINGSVSVTAHSTYSLSEKLFRLVAASSKHKLLSIHHQENSDENQFFKDGSGPIALRRTAFNPLLEPFAGTGKRPIESIAGYFDPSRRVLFVHNTVTEQQDIEFAGKYFSEAYWCLCPNANQYIEKKLPDINLFRKNGCRITLGTDSLASNSHLSILEEIKTIQLHFPDIPLTELLKWGTLNGAEFLGLEHKLGSFEKGKKPGVVVIENVDAKNLLLKPDSTSRLIIPADV